jgi:hypothetical protein
MFYLIFHFEIEYRTSRTIKRDSNSGKSGTKCMFFLHKYLRTQPQTSLASSTFQGSFVVKVVVRGGSASQQLTVTDLRLTKYIPP